MLRLTFGMGPAALGPGTEPLRSALARLLTIALDAPVRVVACRTYGQLLELIADGEVQFAWLPPAIFIRARDKHDVTPLVASVHSSELRYHGVLFVREDSEVRTTKDLKGTTVAWVDRESCAGFLFPRLALMEAGYETRTLFDAQVALGSHAAVVQAVASGEMDVGATYVHVDPNAEDAPPLRAGWIDAGATLPMHVVLRSRPIPSDVICATKAVELDVEKRLAVGLAGLHELPGASKVLEPLLQVRRFEPTSMKDYEIVRAALTVANTRFKRRKKVARG